MARPRMVSKGNGSFWIVVVVVVVVVFFFFCFQKYKCSFGIFLLWNERSGGRSEAAATGNGN